MRIRLTKADLLEWLSIMPDDDRALLTVRTTQDGIGIMSFEVDGFEDWFYDINEDDDR